ncbi:NAD(P)-dependent oxidoreductase [Paenibacillus algorifonticola]|uniref:NAD(P)-dependent oxidoreductase n=1 Tax=Paenibacillus algorifonticola TaxID=684063 RepID=UPI003D2901B6
MNEVTIIGLGAMGSMLARTLLQKNYRVTVWNRTTEKAEQLVSEGASLAPSVGAAISASPVTIVCVSDYQTSDQLLDTEEAKSAFADRVLIQMSTGSPQQARDNEAWAKALGIEYLDGAIAASPSQIGREDAVIFTSGSAYAFQNSEEVLKSLAGSVPYLGEQVSAAATTDLAFLSYLFGSYLGFFHAARIMESDGLQVSAFGAMLAQISPVIGEVIKYEGELIEAEKYDNPQSSLNICMVTAKLLMKQAREAGINNEFPAFAEQLFARALDAGYGNEEVAALIKILR